jgi:hypothetical protein
VYFGREDIAPIPGVNPQTFHVFDHAFSASSTDTSDEQAYAWAEDYGEDSDEVYYAGAPIAGADPKTFKLLANGYAADTNAIYFFGNPISGADVESFAATTTAMTFDASDKNHRYCAGEVADQNRNPCDGW